MLALTLFLLAASPSPESLFESALARHQAQSTKKFTYREELEQWATAKDGTLKLTSTKTFDVIMLEGENYRKLILIDGKPLDAKLQKKVDEEVEKTRTARRRSLRSITRTLSSGGLGEIPRLFTLNLLGEESINGRKAWRVEATPNPKYKPKDKEEEKLRNTTRTYWFDQADGIDVKSRIVYTKATNGFQPGTEIEVNLANINGTWLAETLLFRFDMKAMAVLKARGEARHRYLDYKLFEAESKLLPQ